MRWLRLAAAVVVLAAAVAVVAAVQGRRYHCNLVIKTVEGRMDRMTETSDESITWPRARQNIADLKRCSEVVLTDAKLYVMMGDNYNVLQQPARAEEAYRRALALDRRPEIFFKLGMAQLAQARTEEGVDNIRRAASFRIALVDEIPYNELRQVILNDVRAREQRIAARGRQ